MYEREVITKCAEELGTDPIDKDIKLKKTFKGKLAFKKKKDYAIWGYENTSICLNVSFSFP